MTDVATGCGHLMCYERLPCQWPCSRTFSEPAVKSRKPHFPCRALHTTSTTTPQCRVINWVRNSGGQILKGTYCFYARHACLRKAQRQKQQSQNMVFSQISRAAVRHTFLDFTMLCHVTIGCEMVC